MKTILNKLLIIICLLVIVPSIKSQVIKSDIARIQVNTIPEKTVELVSDIQVLEPKTLRTGETFLTDQKSMPMIMRLVNPSREIKVFVNNIEVPPTANGDIYTHIYELSKGSNSIYISLIDKGRQVKDLVYTIIYTEPIKNLSPHVTIEGKYYALIIANNTYNINSGMMNLTRPIDDARALKDVLTTKYTFEWNNIQTLYDRTKLDVEVTLEELQKKILPEDNLLIFYAGHGILDRETDIGYWLLSNATNSRVTWLSNSTITDFIKSCKARHILLIADACYAGSIYHSRSGLNNASPAIVDLIRYKSRKAITSGGTTEVSDDSKFAQILVDQLKNNTEQYLPSMQLYNLLQKPVLANSMTAPRWGSINNVGDDNGDFVFILRE